MHIYSFQTSLYFTQIPINQEFNRMHKYLQIKNITIFHLLPSTFTFSLNMKLYFQITA